MSIPNTPPIALPPNLAHSIEAAYINEPEALVDSPAVESIYASPGHAKRAIALALLAIERTRPQG